MWVRKFLLFNASKLSIALSNHCNLGAIILIGIYDKNSWLIIWQVCCRWSTMWWTHSSVTTEEIQDENCCRVMCLHWQHENAVASFLLQRSKSSCWLAASHSGFLKIGKRQEYKTKCESQAWQKKHEREQAKRESLSFPGLYKPGRAHTHVIHDNVTFISQK